MTEAVTAASSVPAPIAGGPATGPSTGRSAKHRPSRDQVIARRLREGDPRALRALIRAHGRSVDRMLAVTVLGGKARSRAEVFSLVLTDARSGGGADMALLPYVLSTVSGPLEIPAMDPQTRVVRRWFDGLGPTRQESAWYAVVEGRRTTPTVEHALATSLDEAFADAREIAPTGRNLRAYLAEAVLGPAGQSYVWPPVRVRLECRRLRIAAWWRR